jgi:putative FmdB family regulatory protein
MPLREFLCLECGHVFEIIQSALPDQAQPECRCGSLKTEKIFSRPAGYVMNSGGASTAPRSTITKGKARVK